MSKIAVVYQTRENIALAKKLKVDTLNLVYLELPCSSLKGVKTVLCDDKNATKDLKKAGFKVEPFTKPEKKKDSIPEVEKETEDQK